MIEIKKVQKFKNILEKSEKIVLINHIQMDPDAYGSLGAFYLIAKSLGKKIIAINDSLPPKNFSFLGLNNIFQTKIDIEKFNPDLIISFDAGSEERLGKIYQKHKQYIQKKDFVVFDHHSTNLGFGNLNFIYPKSASTCEIIFEILEKIGLEKYITKEIATLLIAGIHTDTNIFYNQNTRPETLEIAAKLVRYGADFHKTIYNFFHSFSLKQLKLYAKVGEKIQSFEKDKIYASIISKSDFDNIGANYEDTTGLVNKLSNIEGAEIVFIIYELQEETKISMRSKSYDIGNICASFGGGGHKNAAGFTTNMKSEKILEKILEKINL